MTTAQRRRIHGEGAIYETGDGRFRGAVRIVNPATGKQGRRYVSGRNRSDVRRKIADLQGDAAKGVLPTTMTVREYLDHWLAADKTSIRPSSWRQREQYVNSYMKPAIGSIRLNRLTPGNVEQMTTDMMRGAHPKSARTAAATRVILRRALGDAERDGLVNRNAAALARAPRVPTRAMEAGRDYFTPEQLRTLVDVCRDSQFGPLFTVAATTGLRQGELLGLRWRDVDLDARVLAVRQSRARDWEGGWSMAEPKTARSRRMVDLAAPTVTALRKQHEWQAARKTQEGSAWQDVEDLVFTDTIGRPLDGRAVTKVFHRLLTDAGLPSIPFHGLRHTFATGLLSRGVPLPTIANLLGHTTIVVTANIYAAVIPELRRDGADAMDAILSEPRRLQPSVDGSGTTS